MQALLTQLYKQGNQSWLKSLLGSEDPEQIALRLKYVEFLTSYQAQQIHQFWLTQQQIKQQQSQLQQQQQLAQTKQQKLQQQNNELNKDKNKRVVLLASLNSDIKNKDQQLQQALAEEKQLKQLIQTLQNNINNLQLGANDQLNNLKANYYGFCKKTSQ